MKRCPACNARYRGNQYCQRCGMDIAALLDIETQAREHYHKAIQHYHSNDFEQMYFHARRTFSLYRSPEAIKLLACASLMVNRFKMATTLWQQYLSCTPPCSR